MVANSPNYITFITSYSHFYSQLEKKGWYGKNASVANFFRFSENTHKTSISSELKVNVRHTSKENFEPAKSKPHKKKNSEK